jgi:hypothetical protein
MILQGHFSLNPHLQINRRNGIQEIDGTIGRTGLSFVRQI